MRRCAICEEPIEACMGAVLATDVVLRRLALDKVADTIERGGHYMRVWKTGERVTITFGTRTVLGRVKLASSNGRSLMLEFDAMLGRSDDLGGYAGMMPVLEEDGVFRDLILHEEVILDEPEEG